ncbi:MAG: ankyrin repeat domain-containing protein [Chromatiales bacterium]|nr:ankyrin repeat domain-containing protein [Chromatiales bacterium]
MKLSVFTSIVLLLSTFLQAGCNSMGSIHVAALEGNLAEVRDLSRKGGSINEKNSAAGVYEGFTPLHMAINNGHKDVALYLIKGGANVNEKGKLGRTPLHLAAYNGMPQVAKLLISRGAYVNASNEEGATPLHSAAFGIVNSGDLLKILLAKGANVDSGTGTKIGTPLIHATKYGNLEAVKVLLNNGADINARDESGNSALHFASLYGRIDVATYLLMKNPDVNQVNQENNSPLHVAAINGRRMVAEQLVYHGANLIGKNGAMETPLDCAKQNNRDTVVALLEPFTETDTASDEVEQEQNNEPSILAD